MYKPVSKTPLEVINLLKEKEPKYQTLGENNKKLRLSYAGRLDPMAHGVMIVLVGEENKKRTEYEFMEKDYTFSAIFGPSTDTYDILGLLDDVQLESTLVEQSEFEERVNNALKSFHGKFQQKYPPFSSCRVDGKLLFDWAKEGKLNEIKIPEKEVEVFAMHLVRIEKLSLSSLLKSIEEKIGNITSGEFRQEAILAKWRALCESHGEKELYVVTVEAKVSHGTYIRSIAHEIGKLVSTGAVVTDLLRTRVADFQLEDSLRL